MATELISVGTASLLRVHTLVSQAAAACWPQKQTLNSRIIPGAHLDGSNSAV